ncbi:YpiF family protein [Halobacillus kuroshimensis]|uniref:YpiF family protein n=1 Tax=Halobacillus kuroshimensis TaxID=302481 RepID=UPI0003F532F0|nr:YpiF family protein [Halobacillus kuroshimensis]
MKWTKADMTQYLPEKQYVDTLMIPLIPFDPAGDQQMAGQAFQRELNQVFTNLIEKEYRGRIFLSPDYAYLKGGYEKEKERLNEWIQRFREQPFEHVFLFTFDSGWKRHEDDLAGRLIWVPGMSSGSMKSTETQAFVKEQARGISELIQAYW